MWKRVGYFSIVVSCFFSSGPSAEERALLSEISTEELARHAKEIVRHVRDGGSAAEHEAVDYVVRTLRADGIDVEVYEFPAYVSDPGTCRLNVEGAAPASPRCKTQALAAPTPPGGVRGEVVFAGSGGREDYESLDVRGKIVLIDALPLPWGVAEAQEAGAVGAIFLSNSELIQELTVSPIWGTPSHENVSTLPKIPSVHVKKSDGEALREGAGSGALVVSIETSVATGFKTLRLPVASIRSAKDPDGYVLLGGHIDGWHHAAVDEGASNAAMVEMARIFHRNRAELERGLKVAWWPAHSNGRYAGSAWFVDHQWLDLRQNALAYMNIDGVGQMGATVFGTSNTAEMDELARAVLKDVAKTDLSEPGRPGRNSDEGFYGIGLPLLQFSRDRTDPGGQYWWWHTEEDTFDKIDFDILAGDTALYVSALSRLLTRPIPPIRLASATKELETRLEEWQRKASGHVDLSSAVTKAAELDALVQKLDEKLDATASASSEVARRMVRVVRPLIRLTYSERGPYHQDPALEVPELPGLGALDELVSLPSESDSYRFTRVHVVREVNRILDHLDQALDEARTLERILEAPASS
jgi:hypothetical protein